MPWALLAIASLPLSAYMWLCAMVKVMTVGLDVATDVQELVLLEREQEVLEKEQTVGTLREQVQHKPFNIAEDMHPCLHACQHVVACAVM